jgi:hypothetical protein
MSGLLSKVTNKIQYNISQWAADPEADAYAKQQADQAQQDEETKARLDESVTKAAAEAKAKADADAKAAALEDRSQFKPKRAASNIASGILKGFMTHF